MFAVDSKSCNIQLYELLIKPKISPSEIKSTKAFNRINVTGLRYLKVGTGQDRICRCMRILERDMTWLVSLKAMGRDKTRSMLERDRTGSRFCPVLSHSAG